MIFLTVAREVGDGEAVTVERTPIIHSAHRFIHGVATDRNPVSVAHVDVGSESRTECGKSHVHKVAERLQFCWTADEERIHEGSCTLQLRH